MAVRQGFSVMERVLPSDLETPVSAFLKLRRAFPGEPAFLFESVERGEQVGRYSILGFHAKEIVRWQAGDRENPLTLLEKGLTDCKTLDSRFRGNDMGLRNDMGRGCGMGSDSVSSFPGGFGYLNYDAVRAFEKMPALARKSPFPDALFVVPGRMILFDHVRNTMALLSLEGGADPNKELDGLEEALRKPLDVLPPHVAGAETSFRSSETRESFGKKVERAKEYIKSGDIYQVVLSQQLTGETQAQPVDVYRALRVLNPSPYMYFLDFGDFQIIGSSPEMLVKLHEGIAEVRPIAGTRPRGESEEQDQDLAVQLLADPKERAEHVMLVDLGRNDLGRVCEYGSVHLKSYMDVERYSHVMHLVSTVQGKVKPEKSWQDVLQSAFPAGTVTGAPKIRAMEIIDELENEPRGPYAGCVGYVSFAREVDTCITIRTVLMKDGAVWLQAGAGIVADSVPDLEYQETLNKLEGMKKAVQLAERGLRLTP